MKVIWEPVDIIAGRLVKADTTAMNNKYLISYNPATNSSRCRAPRSQRELSPPAQDRKWTHVVWFNK